VLDTGTALRNLGPVHSLAGAGDGAGVGERRAARLIVPVFADGGGGGGGGGPRPTFGVLQARISLLCV
jgi:hypothetical protein